MVASDLLVPARVLWVLFPAYLANAAATFPKGRGPPLDFGRSWPSDRRRLLGSSKTVSGFLAGSFAFLWVGLIQQYLTSIAPPSLAIMPAFGPSLPGALPVLLLLSVGALTGDALGSFLKRRRGVPPGGRSLVLDPLFFVLVPVGLGIVLFPGLFVPTFLSVEAILATLVFTVGLHGAFNWVGHRVGLKKVPW
ncbi:MAG: CDP-archaeol synthase [Thermoplasmata archaeon]